MKISQDGADNLVKYNEVQNDYKEHICNRNFRAAIVYLLQFSRLYLTASFCQTNILLAMGLRRNASICVMISIVLPCSYAHIINNYQIFSQLFTSFHSFTFIHFLTFLSGRRQKMTHKSIGVVKQKL